MRTSYFNEIADKFYIYRYYLLLIAIIINFVIPPLTVFPILDVIFKLITTFCLLFAGANFIDKDNKNLRRIWFLLGFIILGITFFTEIHQGNFVLLNMRYLLIFFFFLVITYQLLHQISYINEVTKDVIIGSFCGYLLIGIITFFLFMLIDFSNPHALSGLSTIPEVRMGQIFYFSLTCITTLGFGDILATDIYTQKLAVFSAMIGQFYIAVVVAILISRYLRFKRTIKH